MQNLIITAKTLDKLRDKHAIERNEVEQCFANRYGKLLIDNREQHKTNPPTLWFLSKTNKGPEVRHQFADFLISPARQVNDFKHLWRFQG